MTATLLILGFKSLIVAAITLAMLRLAKRRSPAERSTIAHLGLFALVALPLASLWLPSLSIALPQALSAPVAAAPMPVAPSAPMDTAWAPVTATPTDHLVAPLDQSPSMVERAASLARYAYALPALALLLLTGIALLRLVTLRSRAQVLIDPKWVGALAKAQHRMGFKNGTALLTSAELHSPISWGLLRPTILVNESALASGQQAEAILAHELAHVIHGDWAKLMLARVATAAFWFNPLAWVLAREAHQLREEAADDAVLAANIAGTDYAELLVGVARHENRGLLLGAHGVAPSRNSLHRRVARVLDKTPARGPSGPSWVAGFTTGMMVMAAPLAAVTFGPARASDQPSAAVAKVAPVTKAWSTRASEAPNQILAEQPHVLKGHRAALANAVNGLGDDSAPDWSANFNADHDFNPPAVPDTSEFAGAWAQWGATIGQRFTEAFAAQPMPAARPAPAARPMPNPQPQAFNFDFDGFAGVTEAYRKEMAEAGFPNATRGELAQARALGLTADFVADFREAGITGSLNNFSQAQAVGLTPDYLQGLREAGMSGSMPQYLEARNLGVTGDYVRAMKSAGLNGTLHDYAMARASGLTANYVRSMAALGIDANFNEYQQMRNMGVTPTYVAALRRNGNDVSDPHRLIELRTEGYRQKDRKSGDP